MAIIAVYSKPQVLKAADGNVIILSACIAADHEHGLISGCLCGS